jgi:hypothetical protein
MDHFSIDSTGLDGACGAGSDFAEWLERGLYAAVTGVGHMQQGKRVNTGAGRASKSPDTNMAYENAGFNSL